jgi:hypothetical protein
MLDAATSQPHIIARAVQTLVSALDDSDRSAAVAAAIALLAIAHKLPVPLLAVEAAGITIEVATDAEPATPHRTNGESAKPWAAG